MVSLVLGGSGQVGRFLIPKLLARGHKVIALSRAPRQSATPNLHWVIGDLFSTVPDPGPIDAVFSLGPLNGFASWTGRAGLRGNPVLIALGSMSALSKRDSPDASERNLAEALRQSEHQVAEIARQENLGWTLLRPTLIYGAGLDKSLSPLARLGMRWHLFPKIPGATGLRQPVHADDLADACLAAMHNPQARQQIFDLGGGERLRFSDMLSRVRESLPGPALGIALPIPALRLALQVARMRPQWRGITSQAIERLKTDLLADDRRARSQLGWSPRAFHPEPATWVPQPLS